DLAAATLDDDLDKNTRLIQQLRRDVKRSIKLPIEETDDVSLTGAPASRASKVLAFDASGAPTVKTATEMLETMTTIGAGLQLVDGDLSLTDPVLKGVAGGTADEITATVDPAPAALVNNLKVCVEASGANATTTPTFALNSFDAKTIVKGSGAALQAGDIPGANYRMELSYDASLDKWVLMNPYFGRAEVQSGSITYVADTGAADAYVATLAPAPAATPEGMEVAVKIANANLTTTPTLNVNGIGAVTIVRDDDEPVLVGDLPAGHIAVFRKKGASWLLTNPCKVTWKNLPDGATVQVQKTQTGAVATGTTEMPIDDTIPQNTEGDEYMTLAITPKATTNILIIDVVAYLSIAAARRIAGALFQDSTANALAAACNGNTTNGWDGAPIPMIIRHTMVAGTTSATTFKFRAGQIVGGGSTVTFNGSGGSRYFGGVMASSITITEIKAS
ncbi:MAG: hypothetical protein C4542_07390, partial [Dehalococcoidia bacterium]